MDYHYRKNSVSTYAGRYFSVTMISSSLAAISHHRRHLRAEDSINARRLDRSLGKMGKKVVGGSALPHSVP